MSLTNRLSQLTSGVDTDALLKLLRLARSTISTTTTTLVHNALQMLGLQAEKLGPAAPTNRQDPVPEPSPHNGGRHHAKPPNDDGDRTLVSVRYLE